METLAWIIAIIATYALGVWKGIKIGQDASIKKERIEKIENKIKNYDLEKTEKCWKRFCDREATTHDGLCQSCKDRDYGF